MDGQSNNGREKLPRVVYLLNLLMFRAGTDNVIARWGFARFTLDEGLGTHVANSLFRELNFAKVAQKHNCYRFKFCIATSSKNNYFHHTFFYQSPLWSSNFSYLRCFLLPSQQIAYARRSSVLEMSLLCVSLFSSVPVFNLMDGLTLPKLCKCLNSAAIACYKKCGGPPPHLKVLP